MKIRSIGIPLFIDNVDTDQIIPARFLKKTDKEGFGEHLFANWRYTSTGESDLDFILNKEVYSGAQILVAGANFGCGSSREHAAWAIKDYGIHAVISTQFADIFKGNALNNGIVPIQLSADELGQLESILAIDEEQLIEIDLEEQTVKIGQFEMAFEIDPFKKECIIQGMDETDYLLSLTQDIREYEKTIHHA